MRRTLSDALTLLTEIRPDTEVTCLGGGFLGLEIAGAIARQGAKVTVLEGSPWLLPRQLPQGAGLLLQRHLEGIGIKVVCNVHASEILGDEAVRSVKTDKGDFSCDLLVLATGIRPNTYLARDAGLDVGFGIRVNDAMATSDANIFAAGDVRDKNLYQITTAVSDGSLAAVSAEKYLENLGR